MKLHEYQSKDLLSRFGVPVPKGDVTNDPARAKEIAESLGGKVVVKAQVLMGGRGKAGGVKLFDSAEEAGGVAKDFIRQKLVGIQKPAGMGGGENLLPGEIDISQGVFLARPLDQAAPEKI